MGPQGDPAKWSVDEVCAWLVSRGLGEYQQTFRANLISGEALLQLTEEDLNSLGLLIGPKRMLIHSRRLLIPEGKEETIPRQRSLQPVALLPQSRLEKEISSTHIESGSEGPAPKKAPTSRKTRRRQKQKAKKQAEQGKAEVEPVKSEPPPPVPPPPVAVLRRKFCLIPLMMVRFDEQDQSLAEKVVLDESGIASLCNRAALGSCNLEKKSIDFDALNTEKLPCIGVYGNKTEIVAFLKEQGVTDKIMEEELLGGTLKPGIYALPTDQRLYVILWHEKNESFAKAQRKDITCNLLRFLVMMADHTICLMSETEAGSLEFEADSDDESCRVVSKRIQYVTSQKDDVQVSEGFSLVVNRAFAQQVICDGYSRLGVMQSKSIPGQMLSVPHSRNGGERAIGDEIGRIVSQYRIQIGEQLRSNRTDLELFLKLSPFTTLHQKLISGLNKIDSEIRQWANDEEQRVQAVAHHVLLRSEVCSPFENALNGTLCIRCMDEIQGQDISDQNVAFASCCDTFVHIHCKGPDSCGCSAPQRQALSHDSGELEQLLMAIAQRDSVKAIAGHGVLSSMEGLAHVESQLHDLKKLRILLKLANENQMQTCALLRGGQYDRELQRNSSGGMAYKFKRLFGVSSYLRGDLISAVDSKLATIPPLPRAKLKRKACLSRYEALREKFVASVKDLGSVAAENQNRRRYDEFITEICTEVEQQSSNELLAVVNQCHKSNSWGYSYHYVPQVFMSWEQQALQPPKVSYTAEIFMYRKAESRDGRDVPIPTPDPDRYDFTLGAAEQILSMFPTSSNVAIIVTQTKEGGRILIQRKGGISPDPTLLKAVTRSPLSKAAFDEDNKMLAVYAEMNNTLALYQFNREFNKTSLVGQMELGRFSNISIRHMEFAGKTSMLHIVSENRQVFAVDCHLPLREDVRARDCFLPENLIRVAFVEDGYFMLSIHQTLESAPSDDPHVVRAPGIWMNVYKTSDLRSTPLMTIPLDPCLLNNADNLRVGRLGSNYQLFSLQSGRLVSRLISCTTEQCQMKITSDTPDDADVETKPSSWNGYMDHIQNIFDKFCIVSALQEINSSSSKPTCNLRLTFLLNMSEQAVAAQRLHPRILEYMDNLLRRINKPMDALRTDFNVLPVSKFSIEGVQATKTFGTWVREMIVLVPLQIARAERGEFRPMSDGKRLMNDESALDIKTFSDRIHFSLYEAILNTSQKPVKVLTSMGKQSTGKSYLLNHVTGSLFDIAGGRCTDGIWLTIRETPKLLYIVLDFEGLGSFERNEQEDMLLSVFNAAISSSTLYKIENRIDKDMQATMQRFQKGVSLIKGDPKLFRGSLNIVVKDVTGRAQEIREIQSEIEQKISLVSRESRANEDFLTQMYGGQYIVRCFCPPSDRRFYRDVSSIARSLETEEEAMFVNGREWFRCTRLLMAKIWTSLDRNYVFARITELREQLAAAVSRGCSVEGLPAAECPLVNLQTGESLSAPACSELVSSLGEDAGIRLVPELSTSEAMDSLVGQLQSWFESNGHPRDATQAQTPKEWHRNFQQFIDEIVSRRDNIVRTWIKINTASFSQDTDVLQLVNEVDKQLTRLTNSWQLCEMKCDRCFLPCLRPRSSHSTEHDCLGTHKCGGMCMYCEESESACGDVAGHDGEHDCKVKPHTCCHPCELEHLGNCNSTCSKKSGHEATDGVHRCNSLVHLCGAACSLPGCPNTCTLPHDVHHDRHKCHEVVCPHKCPIPDCNRTCQAKDHFHALDTAENHFCGFSHQCSEDCGAEGICDVFTELRVETQIFQGALSQFEYPCYSEMNGRRLRCCKIIPPNQSTHEGAHVHSERADVIHYCETKCGACGYFCNKPWGHTDRLHRTNHGNMKHTFWVANPSLQQIGIGAHIYKHGESGQAEMCNMFCQSLGRGHIHIDKCIHEKPEDYSMSTTHRRHEQEKYEPDPDVPKDEMTHEEYWQNFLQFEDPSTESELKEYNLCPYQCSHESHHSETNPTPSYCIHPLWHDPVTSKTAGSTLAQGHEFPCQHASAGGKHHIVFVVDRSGSMDSSDQRPLRTEIRSHHNNRVGSVYESCITFIGRRLVAGAGDLVSMVVFDSSAEVAFEYQPLSESLLSAMLPHGARGGTTFLAGLKMAKDVIRRNLSQDEVPVIVFLSDGGDGSSCLSFIPEMMSQFASNNLSIHTIAYGNDADRSLLRKIAQAGNGELHEAETSIQLLSVMDYIADACAKNRFTLAINRRT